MKKFALFSSLVLLIGVVLAFVGVPVFAHQLPFDDGGQAAPLMIGSVSLFKTRTLTAAINQRQRATSFILSTFFKGEEVFDTEEVDIEIIKGKRRLAPFVAPVMEGKLLESEGRSMKTFKPPYVKPKDVIKPSDLNAPAAGETIYSGDKTRAERLVEKVAEKMGQLDDTINEREEWMACQAIDTGAVVVKGDGVDTSVDFQRSGTHKITLVGTDLWTDTDNSDPGKDLQDWCLLNAKDSGVVSTIAVFGTDACTAFGNHPKVQGKLDNLRINQGKIDPKQLPEGVTFYATYTDNGVDIDIYTYNSWYTDDDGNVKPFVPVDKVWLGSDKAKNKKLYGCIQDLKAGNFAVRRFAKSWEKEDPSMRLLMVQSAPLPALLQPDAFVSAKVV